MADALIVPLNSGGEIVRKFVPTVLKKLSSPHAVVFAAVVFGASTALAGSAPIFPPESVSPNLCPQVKNTQARNFCQDSRVQYYQGNYRIALAVMRKAVDSSPREGVLRMLLARIMFRYDAIGTAERELRQARLDGAPDSHALPLLFYIMLERHEEVNLLNEFPEPKADAKGESAADILLGRALALRSLGRLPEAAAAMDRSLSLNRNADSLLVRADIAAKQNDAGLAKKLVDEAYRLQPNSDTVMVAKLAQLEKANDQAGVLALSDKFLELYPLNSDPREFKIRVFLKQNQDAKAEAEVGTILAHRPKSPLGLFYKAVLLSRAKDKKGAAEIAQGMPSEYFRTRPEFALPMAQIALDSGNVELGAGILGSALSAAPDMVDVRLRLASLRLSQNTPQAALLVLAPIQDSKDPKVQKLLGAVHARIAKDRAF